MEREHAAGPTGVTPKRSSGEDRSKPDECLRRVVHQKCKTRLRSGTGDTSRIEAEVDDKTLSSHERRNGVLELSLDPFV